MMIFPFIFISFFAIGYFIHGFFLGFKSLGVSQILIAIAISCIISIPFLILSNRANLIYIGSNEIKYAISRKLPIEKVEFQGRETYKYFYTIIFCGLSNLILLVVLFVLWYLQNFKSLITDTQGLIHSFYAFLFLYAVIIIALFIRIKLDEKERKKLGGEYNSMIGEMKKNK